MYAKLIFITTCYKKNTMNVCAQTNVIVFSKVGNISMNFPVLLSIENALILVLDDTSQHNINLSITHPASPSMKMLKVCFFGTYFQKMFLI